MTCTHLHINQEKFVSCFCRSVLGQFIKQINIPNSKFSKC